MKRNLTALRVLLCIFGNADDNGCVALSARDVVYHLMDVMFLLVSDTQCVFSALCAARRIMLAPVDAWERAVCEAVDEFACLIVCAPHDRKVIEYLMANPADGKKFVEHAPIRANYLLDGYTLGHILDFYNGRRSPAALAWVKCADLSHGREREVVIPSFSTDAVKLIADCVEQRKRWVSTVREIGMQGWYVAIIGVVKPRHTWSINDAFWRAGITDEEARAMNSPKFTVYDILHCTDPEKMTHPVRPAYASLLAHFFIEQ